MINLKSHLFSLSKPEFIFQYKQKESRQYNKDFIIPRWSRSFFSYRVSPGIANPHLSIIPKESDADFGNLRTSSCAFPTLPQILFYKVPMTWLSLFQSHIRAHLPKADPFLQRNEKQKNITYCIRVLFFSNNLLYAVMMGIWNKSLPAGASNDYLNDYRTIVDLTLISK